MASEYKRGRETTAALTEIRTVLSRAETALAFLDREKAHVGNKLNEWELKHPDTWPHDDDGCLLGDPDLDAMREALGETVRQLDQWRRTGKTLNGRS